MSEQCTDANGLGQTMSIHTRKITDSCRDKDCIEDLRVYLTCGSQQLLDNATNVRVRNAELLNTYIDVEPVAFDRNHYCVDTTFYYRILADAVVGSCRPATLYGCAVFTKRVVLCGEDSRAHIFRSDTRIGEADGCTRSYANRPTAVVEVTAHNSQGEMLTHIPFYILAKTTTFSIGKWSFFFNLIYNSEIIQIHLKYENYKCSIAVDCSFRRTELGVHPYRRLNCVMK